MIRIAPKMASALETKLYFGTVNGAIGMITNFHHY